MRTSLQQDKVLPSITRFSSQEKKERTKEQKKERKRKTQFSSKLFQDTFKNKKNRGVVKIVEE